MQHVQPTVTNNFNSLFGAAAGLVLVLMIVTKVRTRGPTWGRE